ncbi:type I methionyl aminopeptidase [Ornithinimicrobium sediminis]|uniref:type I methionyl aminopeptidase n=1 Tax=Ornithinimicrobium sediminis TaxID=2904603 RepID=UPI001E43B18E|nr:type I methionyl aminopeptidase [Ornithinimicrobium sediminis]MCE0487534.1 type I methionyl aminopeptidase [Ornithinimicrobium sediminis]
MTELRTPAEIEQMRPAGRFVADVLRTLEDEVAPGTNLLDIDARARQMIRDAGATSCYVDYAPAFGRGPFGRVICTSVNDAVLHGLPHDYPLAAGDLLTLDFAVSVQGWVADSAVTFVVGGDGTEEDQHLIATTTRALDAAIEVAVVGNRLGDVSATIGAVVREAGFEANTDFGGHGVGRTMHEEPHVPNDGSPHRGLPLRPGLVIAIEPWVMAGTARLVVDPDGWTLRSANGRRTAHSEHTVAVTADGPLVLTAR